MDGKIETDKKSYILHSAMVLFSQKGFAEVTMQDIANASGVCRATVYNIYSKKEHIYEAFILEGLERLKVRLGQVLESECSAVNALKAAFSTIMHTFIESVDQYPTIKKEYFSDYYATIYYRRVVFSYYCSIFKEIFKRGNDEQELIISDIDAIVSVIVNSIKGLEMQCLEENSTEVIQREIKNSIDFISRAVIRKKELSMQHLGGV
ncbi:TetR/AcrR family transcriptional regulator [Chitinispirillales bacterium ANBcel5]|uniref:TetR/AcrR family transcriptional regulator n=1 Tax=Cellulosispirillum alkaliphilum TaxID=3039283 RepID=UPI002A512402|nr:TetR/AcrR family transcriptional regulator [Chitinispirillales bacterium ANBcel5]